MNQGKRSGIRSFVSNCYYWSIYKFGLKLKFKKYPHWLAYEPNLIPPPQLMGTEGIMVMEEWFRWAEEWSLLLRLYGGIVKNSRVLEIGCGLGRTAFPLRFILLQGSYEGFEICKEKVEFLQKAFHKAYPNFTFSWADIHNTYYNPGGAIKAESYQFPYQDSSFDLVYAASVFTHLLPDITRHYFKETARVLKKGGRVLFSFFILDNYRKDQPRPLGFARAGFNFDYAFENFGSQFRVANPQNPEEMTAYGISLIRQYAAGAGLELLQDPIPGLWSGSFENWIAAQDIIVFTKTH